MDTLWIIMEHIFVFVFITIFMYWIFIIVDTCFACRPTQLLPAQLHCVFQICKKAQWMRTDGSSQMHLNLHASFLPQLLTLSITRHSSQRSASLARLRLKSRRPSMSLTRTGAASLRRMSWSKGRVLEFTLSDGIIFVWSLVNSQWANKKLRPSGTML